VWVNGHARTPEVTMIIRSSADLLPRIVVKINNFTHPPWGFSLTHSPSGFSKWLWSLSGNREQDAFLHKHLRP